ncbi:MAG: ABC transporter permease, partial [Thermoanaerobaculia bacterium]
MPFEWIVAVRYLRDQRMQTALILGGIGVGVGVMIFLSALINGLQQSILDRTLGTQAHIVVRPPEDVVRPVLRSDEKTAVLATLQKPPQRLRSIVRWQQAMESIRGIREVVAIAPTVAGSAFAIRGLANKSVAVRGVDADSYGQIVNMRTKMVKGEFRLRGGEAVIGIELAKDLGIRVGDKLRLATPDERTQVFSVEGIFDAGNKDLNQRWVFVPLRSAQTLLDLQGGISTIEVKVERPFDAESVATVVAARTGLLADSWMKLNGDLLVALRSQNSSSYMIQFFVIVAVALGIASVLIVSVVQRSREIGILRAIGTSRSRVLRIFVLQGAVLGAVGSVIGIVIGSALSLFFVSLARNPDGSATFPVALNARLFLFASAVALVTGVLSSLAPARRAAR